MEYAAKLFTLSNNSNLFKLDKVQTTLSAL